MQGDGCASGELSSPNLVLSVQGDGIRQRGTIFPELDSILRSPHKISQSLLFRIKVVKRREKKMRQPQPPDRQASVGVLRRILVILSYVTPNERYSEYELILMLALTHIWRPRDCQRNEYPGKL